MTTFTVWSFDDPEGADRAEVILQGAQSDGLVRIVDRAVVSWPPDEPRPHTTTHHDDKRRGTGWGAFLGAVIGMLFFMPVVGAAVGAGVGRSVKGHAGTSIGKDELDRIRAEVTPGTSALFLVTEDANLDRLGERFHGLHQKLVTTNLTEAERDVLLETFGG